MVFTVGFLGAFRVREEQAADLGDIVGGLLRTLQSEAFHMLHGGSGTKGRQGHILVVPWLTIGSQLQISLRGPLEVNVGVQFLVTRFDVHFARLAQLVVLRSKHLALGALRGD